MKSGAVQIPAQNRISFTIHHNDFSQATVSDGDWGYQQLYLQNSLVGTVDGNSFWSKQAESIDVAGGNVGVRFTGNVVNSPNQPYMVWSGSNNQIQVKGETIYSAASAGAIQVPASSMQNAAISDNWFVPGIATPVLVTGGSVPSGSYVAFNSEDVSLAKATVGTGINSDGGGFKHIRRTAGCTTSAGTCTTTVRWTNPFADTNYTAWCTGSGVALGVPVDGGITAKTVASVTFRTASATLAAAEFTAIDCSAVHD